MKDDNKITENDRCVIKIIGIHCSSTFSRYCIFYTHVQNLLLFLLFAPAMLFERQIPVVMATSRYADPVFVSPSKDSGTWGSLCPASVCPSVR